MGQIPGSLVTADLNGQSRGGTPILWGLLIQI